MQARTDHPERCWYDVNQLGPCPFDAIEEEPELLDLIEFTMLAAVRERVKNKADGRMVDHYGIDPARFQLACTTFNVPPHRMREALTWAAFVCTAANEAPDAVAKEELEKLRQELEEDG